MVLLKAYNPKEVETEIYRLWEKSGFFNPDKLPGKRKKTYTISLPPPNITGELHMGHALNTIIQDILIRWKRLCGFKTLWLPGTDHAGIATQNVVEKELKKEGLTRFDLGREKFIERVWQWRQKYGNIILEQLKKIGSSCDWSRIKFTLDKDYIKAVEKAFLHYYKKGWICRGKRVINWCSRCQSSLSDLELTYKEEKGYLWYIRYPLPKPYTLNAKPYITVATTRPETMLGDAAVAVNPKDKRYKNLFENLDSRSARIKNLVGKIAILPLVNREIPIIADILVDPNFGTGAVKITPAHDLNDYEVSLRHKLPLFQVIDEKREITKEAPLPYQGLSVLEARKKVIEDLEKTNLLEKVEDYSHQVPTCDRCGAIIELIPSEQWFLKMKELAKIAEKPVRSGKIKFHPKNFEKGYLSWLKNVRDWCISRQLWWGHKIPLKGQADVLDTWFSAALWPFATLGWPIACAQNQKPKIKNKKYCKPAKNSDLAKFYPTDVLSTDRGIINLWVARMIFSGMEFMKEIPFKNVYIHATVLTREGKRMSKSLGTGTNPLDLIEKYGADATRFGIAYQIMGGQDIRFVEDNIVMGKKFCNKIWNAARFILMNKPKLFDADLVRRSMLKSKNLTLADKKVLKTLGIIVKSVNGDLENFRFGKAAHKLYDFFWHDFCDIYIEQSKKQLSDEKCHGTKITTQQTLLYVLLNSLKILHPFLPFITEEIYQKLPLKNKKKFLMIENWPY